MQVEDLLYQKLYLPLDGITKKPKTMSMEDWEVLNRTTLGLILLSLSSVAFNIMNEKMTVDLMATLTKMYEKPLASNKIFPLKRLFNMKMINGSSMAEQLNNFNTMTNQLSSVGIKFDYDVIFT